MPWAMGLEVSIEYNTDRRELVVYVTANSDLDKENECATRDGMSERRVHTA